ncbi:DNA methyltransferase [Vagococcus carniphilus]|uniref:DNA methyltransferase n=1 Tax=Vagococcus carniphilus TaxID=218144 RepID=UPI00288D9ADE|nr:DNA methyltransferase [Vagococcus carniphilus]MDT2832381.1 DNA methyltransferase [Vagococcus carniphilus]MDT2840732.1 DNA methyltransferase [Vagococcus carniphilus]MDT2855807.1 DNA methyltransferase [Vagococcus carniphilus]
MIVWALFDSGNGSYFKSAQKFEEIEIYSIGLDIENKNDHFINLNLADYSYLFKDNTLFDTLDKLPKPDLIIASPPCESWSIGSTIKDGNACWKQQKGDSLFEPQEPLSKFTLRDYVDFENYQYIPENQLVTRINGELCAFNMIQIIRKYNPNYYIIENPLTSKLWDYIEKILGFNIPYENKTYYMNYEYPIAKPTKFKSNIDLQLNYTTPPKAEKDFRFMSWSYNERSNIPEKLVDEIFEKVIKENKHDI